MEPEVSRRCKNFTEREKSLLLEVAKEYVHIIDNKKTDGTSNDAKKGAWEELARKYNAASETGYRTEKQLHALYDNLRKKARRNMLSNKSETNKTSRETFCPKITIRDPLSNEFELDKEKAEILKKRSINHLSSYINNIKKNEQSNEDVLTQKKLELLEIQIQQENIKLENTRVAMELDIELKRVLLENAKMDLELKRKRLM